MKRILKALAVSLTLAVVLWSVGDVLAQTPEQMQSCGTGMMPGDEIIHFRIVNKTNDMLTIQVDYRYNPVHGTKVYLGGYLLDASGQVLSLGFFPATAPTMGQGTAAMQVGFNKQLGRRESTELFIWMYEQYKGEAFVCRRFPYRAFWQ